MMISTLNYLWTRADNMHCESMLEYYLKDMLKTTITRIRDILVELEKKENEHR